jgi:hypothetical protein
LILRRSPFTNARSASQFRPVAGMAALVTDLRLCLARMFATTRKVSARLAPRDAGPGEPQCRRDRCPSVRTRVDAASAAVPLVLRVERRGDLPQRLVRAPRDRRSDNSADGTRRGHRPVAPTPGGNTFPLTATAVGRKAVGLTWQRSEWDRAALHALLRQWVYQDQTFRDLARPPLWGALPCSRRPWSRRSRTRLLGV